LDGAALGAALTEADRAGDQSILQIVRAAAAAKPVVGEPPVTLPAPVLQSYAGTYRDERAGVTLTIATGANTLTLTGDGPPLVLSPTSENTFTTSRPRDLTVSFAGRAGTIETMTVTSGGQTVVLQRFVAPLTSSSSAVSADEKAGLTAIAPRTAAVAWPSFRGANASGVADGQGAVGEWDVATGKNVRWRTAIPGIAVSSPIVTGTRVFVTTSVGADADKTFRTGLYGDVKPVDDLTTHAWKVYALDTRTGAVLWERTAYTGAPRVKRHPKSSQANSTPVTNGTHVVAVFGSVGLVVCYGVDGGFIWQRDIDVIDNGWFLDPTYQWGHSSSPIIYGSTVIVQADQQKSSFLAAFDLSTGNVVWRTERNDEISTWGTPTILAGPNGDELVTNGTRIRGYDPRTGALLWMLGPNSEITVGTPIAGDGLAYITGGYPPVRPIYAVRPGGRGDLSLAKGAVSSAQIAWSIDREGTYIPTPLLYRNILYTLNSNGILSAYQADTGERLYRVRVGGGRAFAASPIAADGRLYFASEDGDVFVAKAGREYVELGKFSMDEVVMATPAISDGVIVVRTLGHVYGLADTSQ
jgi:outer membrane protein assembly factor BamB